MKLKQKGGFIMEKVPRINYKGKEIVFVNYAPIGKDKDKVLELMSCMDKTYMESPEHSVLALVNVENMMFDMDILKKFKESQGITEKYQKKVALVGVKGLLKAGYNFVIGLTSNRTTKAFDSEIEAKEWLTAD
jgi:hypothetical protein